MPINLLPAQKRYWKGPKNIFTLEEAISEMGCVVGMTSREGKERSPLLTPRALAEETPAPFPKTIPLVWSLVLNERG